MSQHDYDGYVKSLEKVYEGLFKDYWSSYVDINRHQVNVGKTYLWVSAALLGLYTAAFDRYNEHLLGHSCALVLGIASFFLSSLAFGICLYAIPARKGYKTIPNKGWGEFSAEAYQHLKDGQQQVYATFLTSHISKIDQAWAHNFKTNQSRALLLRVTSWFLVSSFILALFVASTVSLNTLINPSQPKGEQVMSEETGSNTGGESQQITKPSEPLNVPAPPESADITGGIMSTHSAQPTENSTVFTTESKEEK